MSEIFASAANRGRIDFNSSDDEILDIIHDKHVTAKQLNIFATHVRHLNAKRAHDVRELDKLLEKIDTKLKDVSATRGD